MFDDDSQKNQNDQTDNGAGPAPALGGDGGNTLASPPPTDNQPQDDTPKDDTSQSQPTDTFAPAQSAAPSDDGKLGQIKRDALAQLSPLVHKLDQTPEEKYKTLMMMVQASDNQDLLPEAYEAAQKIEDEKVKAEALLNIVNEVNYFTQKAATG